MNHLTWVEVPDFSIGKAYLPESAVVDVHSQVIPVSHEPGSGSEQQQSTVSQTSIRAVVLPSLDGPSSAAGKEKKRVVILTEYLVPRSHPEESLETMKLRFLKESTPSVSLSESTIRQVYVKELKREAVSETAAGGYTHAQLLNHRMYLIGVASEGNEGRSTDSGMVRCHEQLLMEWLRLIVEHTAGAYFEVNSTLPSGHFFQQSFRCPPSRYSPKDKSLEVLAGGLGVVAVPPSSSSYQWVPVKPNESVTTWVLSQGPPPSMERVDWVVEEILGLRVLQALVKVSFQEESEEESPAPRVLVCALDRYKKCSAYSHRSLEQLLERRVKEASKGRVTLTKLATNSLTPHDPSSPTAPLKLLGSTCYRATYYGQEVATLRLCSPIVGSPEAMVLVSTESSSSSPAWLQSFTVKLPTASEWSMLAIPPLRELPFSSSSANSFYYFRQQEMVLLVRGGSAASGGQCIVTKAYPTPTRSRTTLGSLTVHQHVSSLTDGKVVSEDRFAVCSLLPDGKSPREFIQQLTSIASYEVKAAEENNQKKGALRVTTKDIPVAALVSQEELPLVRRGMGVKGSRLSTPAAGAWIHAEGNGCSAEQQAVLVREWGQEGILYVVELKVKKQSGNAASAPGSWEESLLTWAVNDLIPCYVKHVDSE